MSGRRRRGTGTTPARAGGQDPKRMRPPGLVGAAGSSEPLRTQGDGASGGVEKGSSSSSPATVSDLTVDEHLLECGVCFLPLKPPIFQCGVGHVLCSPCSEKLKDAGKCHLCGVAMPGGYQRCHAMEDMMNSIRGPCPYGCDTRPVYHAREEHFLECPYAPCQCHCPGEECSFVGCKAALLDHCSTAHRWPCITTPEKCSDFGFYDLNLRDGFNLVVANLYTGYKNQGATANIECLLLLTMARARQSYARIISVYCIDPHAAAAAIAAATAATTARCGRARMSTEMHCDLQYDCKTDNHWHSQQSRFKVICTDLSKGLPESDDCFKFILSDPVIGDPAKDGIRVVLRIVVD